MRVPLIVVFYDNGGTVSRFGWALPPFKRRNLKKKDYPKACGIVLLHNLYLIFA